VRITIQKRPFRKGYLVSRNLRDKVLSTHRSRHVPTGGRGRRAYKRHVLRARTAEGLKIRRRTLPYRSHTQDEEERRRSRRIPRFVDGFPEQVQFLGFGSREAVKMSRFAVTLPFNCLMDYYKYNTAAQYLGTGQPLSDVSVDTHHVECVDNFTYLGSVQSSDGYCRPDSDCACSISDVLTKKYMERPTTVTDYQVAHLSDTGCLRLAICIRDMDTTRC